MYNGQKHVHVKNVAIVWLILHDFSGYVSMLHRNWLTLVTGSYA